MPAPVLRPATDWAEYRMRAAWLIVAANESRSYLGKPPQPLLAIPVLEVLLRADGSVEDIRVLRRPTQALDTIKLAEEAVRRAGPFGSVAHLPRPWSFTEVFLFNHQRRFKPMSLDS